jgi:hypothetical protein
MKSISFRTAVAITAPLFGLITTYGCSPEDTQSQGGMAGTSSTAGTPATSTAGTPATSTAGTSSTAGSGGTPGTAGSGGAPNTAGSNATGGTPSTAGAGGSAAGAGGTPGTAGTNATGGAGGAGGAPVVTVDALFSGPSSFGNPGWKDSWWVTGCARKENHDCLTIINGCNAMDGNGPEDKGARTVESFPVGGVKGQKYKVTFRYSAVNEGKAYQGGTKDAPVAGDVQTKANNDSFYRDGLPVTPSNYNVIKLTVFDDNMMHARHFYMNAFSGAQEGHLNFRSEYTKTIVVIGGGKIEHFVQDSNCHAIDNCNDGEVVGTNCSSPRRLPGADGQLMLPPKYMDPIDKMIKNTELLAAGIPGATRAQPWHAQASHLTVTAVETTNDPVETNYQ